MVQDKFGIREIGTYIPTDRIDNLDRIKRFDYNEVSLRDKIGILSTSRRAPNETSSQMAAQAFVNLEAKLDGVLDPSTLDVIILVTQHPDGFGLPHSSANLHGALQLPDSCFAFDVSLGCSGFVAALAVAKGYLQATGGKRAVVCTADPYSISLDEGDKNTSMIFGDAATATLIEEDADWAIGAFDMGTHASTALQRDERGTLRMDGRTVFNFCAKNVPISVDNCLKKNNLLIDEVDVFALHPGSKYIVDTIRKRLGISSIRQLDCMDYGNTISSSVPLILAQIDRSQNPIVLVSGFGVGLSWATTILM